ncbi:MAG: biopolymer transporter ExbD [Elusimicrobiota bacterium]
MPSLVRNRRNRDSGVVRLNITSMIDMFTLMVVFLLKNYSSQGQLVTPAEGLKLPISSIEKTAQEYLSVKISKNTIMVENTIVVDSSEYQQMASKKEYLIDPLYQLLIKRAEEARKTAEALKTEFSGTISIQGDEEIPYMILTKIMYTCGQAGYPNMNLVVYRKE